MRVSAGQAQREADPALESTGVDELNREELEEEERKGEAAHQAAEVNVPSPLIEFATTPEAPDNADHPRGQVNKK